ncbi:MAG TPA: hypothetical protein VNG90_05185, partial [Candidatus Acidoferrum sp.]|nr:hypothetical protein [Candidatus Acidoferrum sp.]
FAQLAYEGMAGYVPGRPETDRGTVMLRAMRWWQQYGIAGPGGRAHKLTAYAGVPLDLDIMRRALWLCNGLCIGLQLPKSAMEQFDNNQPWTYVPGSEVVGGHCVTLVGWDPEWFYFVTWGKLWKMSYEFALAKGMIDEMFACIAVDVMRHGESPQHLKLEELIRDVESVTQRSA